MTCKKCELSIPQQVPGIGSFGAKLIVVGDYPNKDDERFGEPFSAGTDPSREYPGKLMRGAVRALGLNSQTQVYMAYALRCNPFHRSQKINVKPAHISACRINNLETELANISCPLILAAGPHAMSSLLPELTGSFMNHRGKWFETTFAGHKRFVRITFPPAYVQRLAVYEAIQDDDGNVSRGKVQSPVGCCRWMFTEDLKAVRTKLAELKEKGVMV